MAKSLLQSVDKWHKTRTGYLVFGLVELALAYGFASWAIDSGSLWHYAIAILLIIGGVINFIKVFRAPKKNEHKR